VYIPSINQLNDPADGRPLLARLSEEDMFEFLHKANRDPTLTADAQAKFMKGLLASIQFLKPEEVHRQMSILINKHMENYRVYSLSKRYDNLGMWAKYADGSSGYCLEFANEGPWFAHAVEVIYGESIPMNVSNPEQRKSYFLAHLYTAPSLN
jgi:hypothetical protein